MCEQVDIIEQEHQVVQSIKKIDHLKQSSVI
jgi:hypothetical protein